MAKGRSRRLPKLDPCKVNLSRIRRLNENQLMAIWKRLGASRVSRTTINSLLKGIVSNLAAAKLSARIHKGSVRKQAVAAYSKAYRVLSDEFRSIQKKSCGIGPRGGLR